MMPITDLISVSHQPLDKLMAFVGHQKSIGHQFHQALRVIPDARERYVVSASYRTHALLLIYFEAVNQIVMTTAKFL
jgi:hypothetical protein